MDRAPGRGWAQVHVTVPSAAVDAVTDLLWAAGASAVEERRDGPSTLLIADCDVTAARVLLPPEVVLVEVVVDDAWREAWRAHARSTRVDAGFVVHLPWAEPVHGPDDQVLVLEPGHAFGTGAHPTTLACLRHLRTSCPPSGRAVLDVGCGSGALAVGAALLGAAAVTALDIDEAATAQTSANAAANGVADRIDLVGHELAQLPSQAYDLVLANIGARILRELAPELRRVVRPGGRLVLAGLLEDQLDPTVAAFPGWSVTSSIVDDGWVTPVLAPD